MFRGVQVSNRESKSQPYCTISSIGTISTTNATCSTTSSTRQMTVDGCRLTFSGPMYQTKTREKRWHLMFMDFKDHDQNTKKAMAFDVHGFQGP